MATPIKKNLEVNTEYYYCTCGKSEYGVFCNGSHKGSEFAPKKFTVTESKDYYLCACKKTSNAPFCDGSHSK